MQIITTFCCAMSEPSHMQWNSFVDIEKGKINMQWIPLVAEPEIE